MDTALAKYSREEGRSQGGAAAGRRGGEPSGSEIGGRNRHLKGPFGGLADLTRKRGLFYPSRDRAPSRRWCSAFAGDWTFSISRAQKGA